MHDFSVVERLGTQVVGVSRTFTFKSDTLAWARNAGTELESGRAARKQAVTVTFGAVLARYRDEVVVASARKTETPRIARLLKDPLSTTFCARLDAERLEDIV